ncbi:MAG: hypothetical protein C4539_07480 [Ignavibacteriales bacterium]|nr:MAG: hypothetical protein C4539_07480 [Ignavibacteriales bacterium]
MLLETIDIKKNDVLIFSENKFDFRNNFKIVYKKNPSRRPEPLSFEELSSYINNPLPKNLIVYRLLTNQQVFNANEAKYGIYILIDGNYELIYPDPIFAIKEIESFRNQINFETFRFKIQQVGLTSRSLSSKMNDYSEIYFFDLRADEARYQNDKVYAEAIFAFDSSFSGESETINKSHNTFAVNKVIKPAMVKIPVTREVSFSADLRADNSKLQKLRPLQNQGIKFADINQNQIRQQENLVNSASAEFKKGKIEQPQKVNKSHDPKVVQTKKNKDDQTDKKTGERGESLDNLFKSASTLSDFLKKRSKENVILRLDR